MDYEYISPKHKLTNIVRMNLQSGSVSMILLVICHITFLYSFHSNLWMQDIFRTFFFSPLKEQLVLFISASIILNRSFKIALFTKSTISGKARRWLSLLCAPHLIVNSHIPLGLVEEGQVKHLFSIWLWQGECRKTFSLPAVQNKYD